MVEDGARTGSRARRLMFRITTVNAYEMLVEAFDLIRDLRRRRKSLTPGLQPFQDLLDYLSLWQGRILPYFQRVS